jgi:hypothetical protein
MKEASDRSPKAYELKANPLNDHKGDKLIRSNQHNKKPTYTEPI